MQNYKKKILMCSEASYLSSGFSTYAKEILKRLHATGKYEIAEFASYAKINDPRDSDIPWTFYANMPSDNDPRASEYHQNPENQFGRWRFERVLLDFQPDIVFDVRDYWMNAYQQNSPLRPYYHWVVMPTIDSEPQQEEWVDTYLSADAIFTYSDFGRDVLKKQSNNKINYIDTTSPGVDLNVFRPYIGEKKAIRQAFGIPQDAYIFGSIMRNQKRKLIPDLFDTLRIMKTQNPELYHKSFLYLHTSFPDAGWDIPQLLKEYDIANKVLFTYICHNCKNVSSILFNHVRATCGRCGQKALHMPNVNNGVTSEQLTHIINTFDIYVQYAICEGFGMPQVEAASCGIPVASVNYSAMEDIIRKLNGYSINVAKYFKELETRAIRVFPDNNHLLEILDKYNKLPSILQEQKRLETRKLTELHYNWDHIAKKWENYFDNAVLTNQQGKWDIKLPKLDPVPQTIAQSEDGTNYDFVYNLLRKTVPGHPILNSITPLNMIRDLDYSYTQNGMSINPYTRKNVVDVINTIISNHNAVQDAISNMDKLPSEDFIKYAHLKKRLGAN
jgi:glycosyltransferase involved in cell wall biosynthesis